MQPKYYLTTVILITSLVSHNTSQANNTKTTYIGIGAIYSSTKLPPDFDIYNKTNFVKLKNTMHIGCVFSYYFL